MARKATTPAPTTEWLQIAALSFDRTVNTRPPKSTKVDKIAGTVDPEALGIIEVSRRSSGQLVVIDGQHRVLGLRKAGWNNGQMIECKVHDGLTHEQECALFGMLNDETPVSAIHKMLGNIGANKSPDCDIAAIVSSLGLTVADQVADGNVVSAKALRFVYGGARVNTKNQTVHPDLLRSTLRFVLLCWGKNKDALRGDVIEGVAAFIARYKGQFDTDALVTKLSQRTALNLLADARALAAVHGWQMNSAIAARIVMIYNTGRRVKRLPEWGAA